MNEVHSIFRKCFALAANLSYNKNAVRRHPAPRVMAERDSRGRDMRPSPVDLDVVELAANGFVNVLVTVCRDRSRERCRKEMWLS